MDATSKIIPAVSVLLPVYNGSEYLAEAITSILGQSYSDFELIIIDDGSTDDSASIVSSFHDPRIRFFQQENRGLVESLNRGIALARGPYLARQDSDDESLPDRFARQVSFLEARRDYGMVGTWAKIREGRVPTQRTLSWAPDDLALKFNLLFDNPFVHSSMMIRRSVLDETGLYSARGRTQYPEDYDLWSRVARRFKVANIPEFLHVYREVPRSLSRAGEGPFLKHLLEINRENLAWATGNAFPESAYLDLAALWHGAYTLYSRRTPLTELTGIVENACRFLAAQAGVDGSALEGELGSAIDTIRHHRFQAGFWGRQINGGRNAIKGALRSFGLGFREGGSHEP